MAKPWHMDFDPLTESFNKVPIWVWLLNLLMDLWLDFVLETVGDAIGNFLFVDSATSDVLHSTCAQILVETDVSKDLLEKICLDSTRGSWTQMLDYEGIPFRYRKCHMTGHLAARCSTVKSKPRHSPSWWIGASSEHYTMLKSQDVLPNLVDVSPPQGMALPQQLLL